MIGIYIHVPFCSGKCPYCDFYSVEPSDALIGSYRSAVRREMEKYTGQHADTIYFGGGTPTLLPAEQLTGMLQDIREIFRVAADAEITVEMNPRTANRDKLHKLRDSGFNRLSMGVQSGVDSELAALGRRHTTEDAHSAVRDARDAGFENISLDLMLGIPGQTPESLTQSVETVCGLDPEHISAYILKIEPGTPFAAQRASLDVADDDMQADLYTQAVEELESHGYHRYEISNFSRPGKESRHNTSYWDCREYLGFGPAAHSFFRGRRFFYPRDLSSFLSAPATVDDGEGGSREEYIMLHLRLAEGVTRAGWLERFGEEIPGEYFRRARPLEDAGLLVCDCNGIRLDGEGFLLSNAVIARIIGE